MYYVYGSVRAIPTYRVGVGIYDNATTKQDKNMYIMHVYLDACIWQSAWGNLYNIASWIEAKVCTLISGAIMLGHENKDHTIILL